MAAVLPNAAFLARDAPDPCDMAPFGYQWFSLRDRRPEALLLACRRPRRCSPRSSMPNSSIMARRITNSRL